MKTVTIQIGNSDNKLRQVEWCDFVNEVENLICRQAVEIHFSGGSATRACWQNFCWVFNVAETRVSFRRELKLLAKKFRQESIAMTIGETEFV